MSPGYEFRLPSYPSTAFPSLTTAHVGSIARDRTLGGIRMFSGTDWVHEAGEVVNVKAFGAIGNGVLHPLSERFATLAAAQAVYPHATALTEQIDGVAIQAALNAVPTAGFRRAVKVPPGDYLITSTITLPLEVGLMGDELVRGSAGQGPTRLWWAGGAAGGTMMTCVGAGGASADWIVQRIANLSFRGTASGGGGQAARAIFFDSPAGDDDIEFFTRLEELEFQDFSGNAIRISGTAENLRWRNLRFDQIEGAAISIARPDGIALIEIDGVAVADVGEGVLVFDTPPTNSNFEGVIAIRNGYIEPNTTPNPPVAGRGIVVTVDTDNTTEVRYNYDILLDNIMVIGTASGSPLVHNKGTQKQDNFSVTLVNTILGVNTLITGSTTAVPTTPTQRKAPLFVFAPLGTVGNGFSLVRLLAPVHVRRLITDINSPAQLTADQHNYSPSQHGVQRLSSDAPRVITGIVAGWQGLLTLINAGSFNIRLDNESTSSTAANRIITGSGASLEIAPNTIVSLIYDETTLRWRVIPENGAFADGQNIVVGTTSGTKIGTSTSQKLGFWNATPIIQPSSYTTAAITTNRVWPTTASISTDAGGAQFTSRADFEAFVQVVHQMYLDLRSMGLLK